MNEVEVTTHSGIRFFCSHPKAIFRRHKALQSQETNPQIPPGVPMPPATPAEAWEPTTEKGGPVSGQLFGRQVADAGGSGGIDGEKEGRIMIRVIYSFLYLSTIPLKIYIPPFWSLKV